MRLRPSGWRCTSVACTSSGGPAASDMYTGAPRAATCAARRQNAPGSAEVNVCSGSATLVAALYSSRVTSVGGTQPLCTLVQGDESRVRLNRGDALELVG